MWASSEHRFFFKFSVSLPTLFLAKNLSGFPGRSVGGRPIFPTPAAVAINFFGGERENQKSALGFQAWKRNTIFLPTASKV